MDPFDLRHWKNFEASGGSPSSPSIVDQIVIDSRRIDSAHSLFIALPGNRFDGHQFISHAIQQGARYAIVNKNWAGNPSSIHLLRVPDPLKAFQEIAHAYRSRLRAQVTAIIGTHGKTMVKDLLFAMSSGQKSTAASPESFNSQIGVPLSLLTIGKEHEIALIEAAASQKTEMDALTEIIAPDNAILTHIGKKHLATFGNIQTAAQEMIKLLQRAPKQGWVLLPNHGIIRPFLDQIPSSKLFWNERDKELPYAIKLQTDSPLKMDFRVHFPDGNTYDGKAEFGFYYYLDLINITVKAAWKLGISSETIISVLKRYVPEPMRTEIWKSNTGTTFINETYCSDPLSIDQAVQHFKQAPAEHRKTFIFGGMRGVKGRTETDFRHIGKAVAKAGIKRLLLVGDYPYVPMLDELNKQSLSVDVTLHKTIEEAFAHVRPLLHPQETVLIKGKHKVSLDELTRTFNDCICSNQCIINLAAIDANIATIRQALPPDTRIMVMVKALAYGTDEVRMARFLETCHIDILGVSYVDEGASLRRAGAVQSIFTINAALYEVPKVVKWDLEVGVSEKELILSLAGEAEKHNKRIKVHLHVDTGMSRFGCRPKEALELAQLILQCPSLILEGIMTHFACADDPLQDEFTWSQIKVFQKTIQTLEAHSIPLKWRHACNSSGALRFKFPEFNMVRIGLAVYGLHSSETTREALELRLALSLLSRIVGINVCKKGETISYGRSYTVKRDVERIAVLPIGYFDGLHRNYSGKGHVMIRGEKAHMVGKICMDFMMVDVTDIPSCQIGDPVLIFGEDEHGQYLAPEDVAVRGDSIVHELITCLGPRIERVFVYEEALKNH